MKKVFLFPGQGSQYPNMAKDLYESNDIFRRLFNEYRAIVFEHSKIDLNAIFSSDEALFEDNMLLSSLAIFSIERCMVRLLNHYGYNCDAIVAVSLGTLAATAFAENVEDEKIILSLVKQTIIFEEFCLSGGMIYLSGEKLEQFLSNNQHEIYFEIASYNFKNSIVVSCLEDDIASIVKNAKTYGLISQIVPVNRAYHSKWIDEAENHFYTAYSGISASLDIDTYFSNSIHIQHEVTSRDLWSAVRSSICFQQQIEYLEAKDSYHYIDIGPSGNLATYTKYILEKNTDSCVSTILTPFGKSNDKLKELIDFNRILQ